MSGQTDILEVLKSLQVSCDDMEYGFGLIENKEINLDDQILGLFKEKEGLTVIAPRKYLETKEIKYDGMYAKLTIEAHTSLELVGLTAVLCKKLADNNISANVVAGYYHDHIFVQYDLRQKAIDVLSSLRYN
jgi:uncharacterized protein